MRILTIGEAKQNKHRSQKDIEQYQAQIAESHSRTRYSQLPQGPTARVQAKNTAEIEQHRASEILRLPTQDNCFHIKLPRGPASSHLAGVPQEEVRLDSAARSRRLRRLPWGWRRGPGESRPPPPPPHCGRSKARRTRPCPWSDSRRGRRRDGPARLGGAR